MQVRILGSAAGGGFPQWNCSCRNCRGLREGSLKASPRTQAQVAVSSDGDHWFLLNASPDLRAQIECSPCLRPRNGRRSSPIAGIVLTGADLDQVLGLLLLREFQPLHIYATKSVRRLLVEDNTFFAALTQVPDQARWTDVAPGDDLVLSTVCDLASGIQCRAIAMDRHFPGYVPEDRRRTLDASEAVLALIIEGSEGGRLLYAPSVATVDEPLLELMESADVVLFDGTFWSDDELVAVSGRSASQMGHIPVGGRSGSLELLAGLKHPRKIYVHVNNTNPMLDEDSPQHRAVCNAGWEIAEDGWQLEL